MTWNHDESWEEEEEEEEEEEIYFSKKKHSVQPVFCLNTQLYPIIKNTVLQMQCNDIPLMISFRML